MALVKRLFFFFAVNLLIMVMIGVLINVLSAFGIRISPSGYGPLLIWSLLWGMGGSFISLWMSKTIAKWSMGVKTIDPATHDPELRWLVSTVRSMAERSGIRNAPEVGIYESDEVNAFATGPTKNRSLVAVSTGLLHRLSRDQAEAVLGHEVSHVANGDMVTMTLLQGIVNAFVLFFARIAASIVGSQVEERNRWAVEFAVSIVLQIALGVLGSMVVFYFSRRREFRADAGGATLAGRGKMISALRALGQTRDLIEPEQPAMASLKIAGAQGMMRLFMTHPPLEERIAALERAV